ncbi:hypothetical protein [Streptomyces avermitilis]|uniref:hypothetical protein n=1 Tax=Streptomyces avermitilis TaxID=33903 RepID=UPI000B20DE62|nr:hypothetical protein [Streptomyces avermitilis]
MIRPVIPPAIRPVILSAILPVILVVKMRQVQMVVMVLRARGLLGRPSPCGELR